MKRRLSVSMTLKAFENGYWYATELKEFADRLGIPSPGLLRNDELERAVQHFLRTRQARSFVRRALHITGPKDVDRGLRLRLPVSVYTNDAETKDFIEKEARKLMPGFKRKSGARYRLNRWREDRLTRGMKITYGDLVAEYIRLNRKAGAFARVPHGRYINFISDFLAHEPGAIREEAVKAWHRLKAMDVPKDYRSWSRARTLEGSA